MKRTCALILFLLSVSLPESDAQPGRFRFQHLTVDDGLSQDIITAIAQDDLGFMWFGTEDGLNLYDGFSFKVFKHTPGDSSTLAGNDVTSILPDGRGRLWVGTASGLDLIDVRTRAVRHVSIPSGGVPLSVNALCSAPGGDVWVGTSKGLFRSSGLTLSRASLRGNPVLDLIWGLAADGPDTLWCISARGLECLRPSHDTLVPVDIPASFSGAMRGRGVTRVFRDRERMFWVCTGDSGIFRFDPDLHPAGRYRASGGGAHAILDNGVRTVVEDPSGFKWFGTMSGLEVIDPEARGITHLTADAGSPTALLGTRGYALYVDRSGILWIGTYRGGINTYAPSREKFRLHPLAEGSSPLNVYSMLEAPDGTILAGTEHGVYSPAPGGSSWIRRPGYGDRSVYCLSRTGSGEIWLGTEGLIGTLPGYSKSRRVIRLPVNDPVRCILEYEDGGFLIGTDVSGVFRVGPGSSAAVRWSPRGEKIEGGVWTITRDSRGALWIGTWGSPRFYRYDGKTDSLTRFGQGPGFGVEFSGTSVKAIREDSAGNLWLGTWGTGLYRRDHGTGTFTRYTETDGLSNNFVKSVEIDRHGKIWVGTERGLTWLDPSRGSFRNFTQRDGLLGTFFYSGASIRDGNGVLYFGGPGGLISFDPDSLRYNQSVPPVVITGFNVFDRPVPRFSPGGSSGPFELRYDQVYFSFEFVALDFTDPPRNRYAYMLEGFDRTWIDAGGRRFVSYTHLDPGAYTFRVRASNSDGLWNDEGASLALVITPAFWTTWWFRTAVAALLLLLSYGFYRARIRTILEVERLRQRIARDLHDDIGTNLSAIVLASEMAGHGETAVSPPPLAAFDEIRTIALLTQEHMRDIVWMLNPTNDSVGFLVARMREDAARLLRNIPHTFRAPEGSSPVRIELGRKRNFFLVYKEALHNIVRHSGATAVDIEVTLTESDLAFSVRDNGKGFEPETVVHGNGIDSMVERARQLGAGLRIESGPGKGTRITLGAKIA